MFKNYFKTAWRNIWKHKTNSAINLFGLSAGITAAVFIFLWVKNEISFNDYHPGKEHIFRITNSIQVSKDESWVWESSPLMLAGAAKEEIPGIRQTARLVVNTWSGPVVNINHQLFEEKTSAYVDATWFDVFHYDFLQGNASTFAGTPFSLVLTESKAKKYFGTTQVFGQTIKVDSLNYTVAGVIKDNPLNSSFQFDILFNMQARLADPGTFKNDNNWNNFGYITFLQLRPDADTKMIAAKLNGILNKNRSKNSSTASLQPLAGMYFEQDLQSSELPQGNKKTTYIFSILGLLLLLVACINYVNLTTARASLRAKEISVRKIVGAGKPHLFLQFIAESLTICSLALLVSIVLIQLCLPAFNALTEKNFESPFSSMSMWEVLIGTLFIAVILNGIYPAILLSSFKPLNVFRGRSVLQFRDAFIRKTLVILQFSLSMMLIVGTIVIYRQLHFIQTTNPGYKVSQVVSIQVPWKAFFKREEVRADIMRAMKQDLKGMSSVADVSTAGNEIINVTSASSGNADWDGRDTNYNPTIAHLNVDADFQRMFDLKLIAGSWFSANHADERNYILNETAAKEFKIHQPIVGQRFSWGGDTGKVIAVVKDFYYKSMHDKIGPMVLSYNGESSSYIFIKTAPGNTSKALSKAAAIWAKYIPGQPFSYNFLDDSFNRLYKSDIRTSKLILIFSLIAIIISALGLFGLAAFTAERRSKEIGIRKVMGASVQQVTALLSKEFVQLVIIAIAIATPLSAWIMHNWLQNFAYRISLGGWIFIAAGLLALVIAIVAVSVQAIKAAIANPVKSLRTE